MKRKGISLIVLVLTVIVIIILAAAIILNIANTNVIDNSHAAVFKSDVAAMQDELTMYIADEYTDALGKYDAKKLQATEDGIWYGSTQQEGNITDIITSMDEKYVGKLFIQDGKLVANKMNVTVEEEKWLGDIGVTSTTQTDIGVIKIIPSTDDWTNGNISLTIEYSKEIPQGYEIEYKINNGAWQKGTQVIVEENNTHVASRLYSKEKDNEALTNSYTVSKIDKEVPDITNMKVNITASTNSITVIASGAIDTLSGEIKYKYSIDGTTWQDSGVFNGYKNATEVTVYVKAIDKVGNESASISNKGTTTAISGTVSITQSPAAGTWTKGNVTVTLSYANIPSGYVMQYKLGSGAWTAYNSALTVSENNTKITARLYNSSVNDEVSVSSKTIANIDKVAPVTPTSVSITVGTNSVTATATGSSDTLSGFSKYQYSKDNSTWQDSGTFSGIKSGTATTIYARAVDKVGNVSASISNKGTTTSLGAVTITPSTTSWTKGNVTVTLSHTAVSGYTLQYKIGSGAWTTYSSALTITDNNTTVYGRMYNSTLADEGNSATSKTIANIDKVAPNAPTTLKLVKDGYGIIATASGSSDSQSGFSKYQYSLNNSTWQDSGTFNNLTYGSSYTVYSRAIDKLGNISSVTTNTITIEYAKSGLKVHYDSINNSGNGWSTTASNWKDLSGNGNDGTIISDGYSIPWASGTGYFNARGNIITVNNPINLNSDFTIEMMFQPDTPGDWSGLFAFDCQTGGVYDNARIERRTGNSYGFVGPSSNPIYAGSEIYIAEFVPGGKYTMSFVFSNNSVKVYSNGVLVQTFSAQYSTLKPKIITFGARSYLPSNSDPLIHRWNGNVFSIRVYNKALTETEIHENHSIDRKRFF